MRIVIRYSLAALAIAIGLGEAHALTLEEIKSAGYIQAATANEVPYGYAKEDGSVAGIGPDVAVAVLKRMGIDQVNWTVRAPPEDRRSDRRDLQARY